MSKADRVYLITAGQYSDYSVHCAFTTLDLALEYAARQNDIPVDVQRRYYELTEETKWSAATKREADELERRHPKLDDSGARVEARDLHDSLPVVT